MLCVEALLAAGAKVDAVTLNGMTPLQMSGYSRQPIIRRLLEAGADATHVDNYGATPMHAAARADNVKGIKALIEAGASTTSPDNRGRTPRSYALDSGAIAAARMLA